jgi:phosphatidyl-myo-inositol alpha-mannosyltransferase
MRVGLVSPYNMFRGSGVKEHVLAVQAELIRRGHEAIVITPQPRNYDGPPPDNMIFVGGSTDFKSPFHTTAQVSVTVNPDRVEQVLHEHKFDILHFHEPWVPVIGRQILGKSNTINVATFHAKLPDNIMSRTIERVITPYTKSIIKYLDVLTAVSEPAAEYVRHIADLPVEIIPNGIDLHKYKSKPHPPMEAPTILYVGRLEKRKGVKCLIEAFGLLQQRMPNARLLIGGEGPDREKLEMLVEEEDIDNVTFLGFLEDTKKIHLMQTVDLFCSPALYGESFGIVLLEALACGTPTVAGANPGYQSVLQGRGALGLVNPKDQQEFARRLELLLTDQDLRKAMTKWAKEYVKQFDYKCVVDQYEAVYARAAKKAR